METHTKTPIVMVSFTITFAGWWAWNAFLSGAYTDNISPYDVKGGFSHTFGKDWRWWLVLVVSVAILVVVELVLKAAKKPLGRLELWPPGRAGNGEWEVETWQEVEKDEATMRRLASTHGNESPESRISSSEEEDAKHGAIELHDFAPVAAASSSRRPPYERQQTDTHVHGKVDVRVTSTEMRR